MLSYELSQTSTDCTSQRRSTTCRNTRNAMNPATQLSFLNYAKMCRVEINLYKKSFLCKFRQQPTIPYRLSNVPSHVVSADAPGGGISTDAFLVSSAQFCVLRGLHVHIVSISVLDISLIFSVAIVKTIDRTSCNCNKFQSIAFHYYIETSLMNVSFFLKGEGCMS